MEEAQALADRVAVMRAGRIVAEGPPDALGAARRPQIRFALPDGTDPAELATLTGGLVVASGGRAGLEVDEPTGPLHRLTGWALERGMALDRLEVVRPSLEDVYLGADGGRRVRRLPSVRSRRRAARLLAQRRERVLHVLPADPVPGLPRPGRARPDVDGRPYADFFVPGMLGMAVV